MLMEPEEVARLYDGTLEKELFGDHQSGVEEEEGDSEVAVRPPDDDAALLAQHPEGVGPREGQSVKLAPSDEEETAVRVAVSVQWALTGTPLISTNLDLRDSIATVQGVVSFALYKPGQIVDPQTLKIIHGERTLQPTKTLAELSSELGHPPVLELGMVQGPPILRPGGDRPRDVIPRPPSPLAQDLGLDSSSEEAGPAPPPQRRPNGAPLLRLPPAARPATGGAKARPKAHAKAHPKAHPKELPAGWRMVTKQRRSGRWGSYFISSSGIVARSMTEVGKIELANP